MGCNESNRSRRYLMPLRDPDRYVRTGKSVAVSRSTPCSSGSIVTSRPRTSTSFTAPARSRRPRRALVGSNTLVTGQLTPMHIEAMARERGVMKRPTRTARRSREPA
jgi:hypothetical protein